MNGRGEGVFPLRGRRLTWAVLAALTLFSAVVRFYRLGVIPPGLYHDEAFNGLDASRILEGECPLFFAANNGREPFFLYGMALSLALLGRTPFAVRAVAALLGTLTTPATFLMAEALFDRRVGLWSACLMAFAPWPVNLGRIGLRAVSMPLVAALGVWAWWKGHRDGTAWALPLGGALLGFSLYTYTAARFVPVAVALYVLFQMVVGREPPRRGEVGRLTLAALLTAMPLFVYGVTHWDTFVERPAQVSVFNTAINHGDLWGTLAHNVVRAGGLFTFRGDSIPRHNVPSRPLFDPLMSVFFYLGVLLCLVRAKRDGASALVLVWTGVMLLPTILAEDCPHFLRAVGVLPMATTFPALGLEWMQQRLGRIGRRSVVGLLPATVMAVSVLWGGYDYFVRHGGNPDLAYAFEADQVQEAVEINRFLGSGWQGKGIREPSPRPVAGRHVYLGPRLWEDRLTVNFLVAAPDKVSILGRDPPSPADEVLVLAWPHGDMRGVCEVFPHPARIEVWRGPLERGDLDSEPRLLYVAFRAGQVREVSEVMARFEEEIELLGWRVSDLPGKTRVELRWRVARSQTTDYTVFVHLVSDGRVIAQDDSWPGMGFFPTTWWRPGDEVVDVHYLDVPYDARQDRLFVGWYELGSMRNLRVQRRGGPGEERLELR